MSGNFIDDLPFPEEDRAKLASFGASSPLALLSMRKASPQAFDNYLGPDRAAEIARHLESMLTDQQRQALNKPATNAPRRFGARLDPLPRSKDS